MSFTENKNDRETKEGDKPSRKKPMYPVKNDLRQYLKLHGREVDAFAQAGKSTFGSLDEQARNELTATLQSLQQASDNLVRITQKFDQGPADYVLGGETLPVYTPEANKQ